MPEKYEICEKDISALFNMMEEAADLEKLPRMGLRLRGVKDCENVSTHVFETALLSMLLGDMLGKQYNMEKILRIALLHELAEARITDIPFRTMEYLDWEEKSVMEKRAFADICRDLPFLEKYRKLFDDFEGRRSPESKLVRAADKLQMMMKVYLCEKEGWNNLDVYWQNKENFVDFDAPIAREFYEFLKQKRKTLKGKK